MTAYGYTELEQLDDDAKRAWYGCPMRFCPSYGGGLLPTVRHLYEDHYWSRDRVAEWIEKLAKTREVAS